MRKISFKIEEDFLETVLGAVKDWRIIDQINNNTA